jgi:hypothetical protein
MKKKIIFIMMVSLIGCADPIETKDEALKNEKSYLAAKPEVPWWLAQEVLDRWNELGITPSIDDLPEGLYGPMPQVMDEAFAPLGSDEYPIKAMNIAYCGGPVGTMVPGVFAKYMDPTNQWYQAWTGSYYLTEGQENFLKDGQLDLARAYALGNYDMLSWLAANQDPSPQCEVASILGELKVEVDGEERVLHEVSLNTHSALTDIPSQMSQLFGVPDPATWKDQLDPYHPITLTGFFGAWLLQTGELQVVYSFGASNFVTKDGTVHGDYSAIRSQLLENLEKIENRHFHGKKIKST